MKMKMKMKMGLICLEEFVVAALPLRIIITLSLIQHSCVTVGIGNAPFQTDLIFSQCLIRKYIMHAKMMIEKIIPLVPMTEVSCSTTVEKGENKEMVKWSAFPKKPPRDFEEGMCR